VIQKLQNQVRTIRKFNRYYTNILGLLDQHILESGLSLSEVRALHEIDKTQNCTSKMLSDILCINAGYLSRILKRFENMGLLEKEPSTSDGRVIYLKLTKKGKEKINILNKSSDEQIANMIKTLSDTHKERLVQNMTSIETILTDGKEIKNTDISIRTEIKAGDAGYITFLHGLIYKEEYNYSPSFEAYVAESFFKFLLNYNPQKDRLWCAEHNGQIIGCIGIVGHEEKAQLRWFLIDPLYRGIGLGKKLLTSALEFAKERGYKSIYLDTSNDLEKAMGLYKKFGFKKVSEKPNNSWREGLVEIEFAMDLD
jgi:DNA-binding MarR family transcriptional regulator/ribosomal protein S18 acetylase RimI-like enzyme